MGRNPQAYEEQDIKVPKSLVASLGNTSHEQSKLLARILNIFGHQSYILIVEVLDALGICGLGSGGFFPL